MKDNFTIIDESEINMYNDNVFAIFEKYNKDKFRLGFIDCSKSLFTNIMDWIMLLGLMGNLSYFKK